MIGVSAIITNVVLARLSATQEQHLKELTDAYLDGLSTAVLPLVLRQDVWEVYDVLDRSAGLYQGLSVSWTTVTGDGGLVLASSHPVEFPSQSQLPSDLRDHFRADKTVAIDTALGLAFVQRELAYQGQPIGAIYARVDISGLLRVRASVLLTLVLTNAGLTLLFAALGYVTVRRMLRPIGVLSRYLVNSRTGPIEALPHRDLGHGEL